MQRILVHCSAGRGRTGCLIAAFNIAETLLAISEQLYPSLSSFENAARQEPDPYYVPSSLDQGSYPHDHLSDEVVRVHSGSQLSKSNSSIAQDSWRGDLRIGNRVDVGVNRPQSSWCRISVFAIARRLRE